MPDLGYEPGGMPVRDPNYRNGYSVSAKFFRKRQHLTCLSRLTSRVQQGSKTWLFWKVFGGLIEIRATESMGLRV